MSVLVLLSILVIVQLFLNVKSGVHQSQSRLINYDGIELNAKWHLLSRWPP